MNASHRLRKLWWVQSIIWNRSKKWNSNHRKIKRIYQGILPRKARKKKPSTMNTFRHLTSRTVSILRKIIFLIAFQNKSLFSLIMIFSLSKYLNLPLFPLIRSFLSKLCVRCVCEDSPTTVCEATWEWKINWLQWI